MFASSRTGNYEVHVMDCRRHKTSANSRRGPLQDIRPRFSPDGSRIAFTSHRDLNAEVYVMDADGGGVERHDRIRRAR